MIISLRAVVIIVLLLYCVITFYTGYILLNSKRNITDYNFIYKKWSLPDDSKDWYPWEKENSFELKKRPKILSVKKSSFTNKTLDFQKHNYQSNHQSISNQFNAVEIWGKAAIGLYLWEHIFNGELESKMNGVWSYGFKKINNLELNFRTGPGIIPSNVPKDVKNLIIVLNGRSKKKVDFAKMWLNYLPQFHNLHYTILVILGNEQCENDWLVPYTTVGGGLINSTFIVYDTTLVDNLNFYQFPLGVATYRGFPNIDPYKLDLESVRPFICNFIGTIYPNSSRERLLNVIQKNNLIKFCFIRARHEWQPKETKRSLKIYIQTLRLSDLTLNPVGQNTECYRIYEAMSLGSVPVVEDNMTPGACGDSKAISSSSPLRLLKLLKAPIIYINDWNDLPDLIFKETKMTLKEKINRRFKVVQFYENFKVYFQDNLLSVIKYNIYRRL